MTTLTDLLRPVTEDEANDLCIGILSALGFPSTSWQKFAFPRLMVRLTARLYSATTVSIANVAAGGFLQLAKSLAPAGGTSPWLDLLAASGYQNTRFPATTNAGVMRLTDAGGNGPTPIIAGQRIITTLDGTLRWNVLGGVTGATLPQNGFLDVYVSAEQPGAAWNIASNFTGLKLATVLAGVVVSNPIPTGESSWITEAGTDVESDDDLIERCQTQWATLGTGGQVDAYENWARTGAPAVTRVLVNDTNPDGPGTVRVTLATGAGPASSTDVDAADAYIQARRALTATVTTDAASALVLTVAGQVYVRAAQITAATTAIAAALNTLVNGTPIGGILYYSAVVAAVGAVPGVRNFEIVTVNGGTTDITLSATQVATLSLALSYFIV